MMNPQFHVFMAYRLREFVNLHDEIYSEAILKEYLDLNSNLKDYDPAIILLFRYMALSVKYGQAILNEMIKNHDDLYIACKDYVKANCNYKQERYDYSAIFSSDLNAIESDLNNVKSYINNSKLMGEYLISKYPHLNLEEYSNIFYKSYVASNNLTNKDITIFLNDLSNDIDEAISILHKKMVSLDKHIQALSFGRDDNNKSDRKLLVKIMEAKAIIHAVKIAISDINK